MILPEDPMTETDILGDLEEASRVLDSFIASGGAAAIEKAGKIMAESLRNGGKIISCGNGGSNCDAMHFAEELPGRYRNDRRALGAVAIDNPGHLTCVGNDYGFNYVFSRFVEGVGRAGDVLLGISTSGNSGNIVEAVESAKKAGIKTVVLTGNDGGKLAGLADAEVRVPFHGYSDRIQEVHIKIIHILIRYIEDALSLSSGGNGGH